MLWLAAAIAASVWAFVIGYELSRNTDVYTVITTENYIPHIQVITYNKKKALYLAKNLAKNWTHESTGTCLGEIYFNQKEDGNMENTISVQQNRVLI